MFRDYFSVEKAAKDAELDYSPIEGLIKINKAIFNLNVFLYPFIILIVGFDLFGLIELISDESINQLLPDSLIIGNSSDKRIVFLSIVFIYSIGFFILSHLLLVPISAFNMYLHGKLYDFLYRVEYAIENIKYYFIYVILCNFLLVYFPWIILFDNESLEYVSIIKMAIVFGITMPVLIHVDIMLITFFVTYILVRLEIIEL